MTPRARATAIETLEHDLALARDWQATTEENVEKAEQILETALQHRQNATERVYDLTEALRDLQDEKTPQTGGQPLSESVEDTIDD